MPTRGESVKKHPGRPDALGFEDAYSAGHAYGRTHVWAGLIFFVDT